MGGDPNPTRIILLLIGAALFVALLWFGSSMLR